MPISRSSIKCKLVADYYNLTNVKIRIYIISYTSLKKQVFDEASGLRREKNSKNKRLNVDAEIRI